MNTLKQRISSFIGALVYIFAVILLLASLGAGLGWLVPEDKAIRALEEAGYTDVSVVGRDVWFVSMRGGSVNDNVRFVCRGKNAGGWYTTVYVYVGWWPPRKPTLQYK